MKHTIQKSNFSWNFLFILAGGMTALWAIVMAAASIGHWNDLSILLPVQFAIIFGAILLLNNPGADGKLARFWKRLSLNMQFGLAITFLFALVQLALLAIVGPEAVPERIRGLYGSTAMPVILMGLTTFGFAIVSIYISMVLYRRRMGRKRI